MKNLYKLILLWGIGFYITQVILVAIFLIPFKSEEAIATYVIAFIISLFMGYQATHFISRREKINLKTQIWIGIFVGIIAALINSLVNYYIFYNLSILQAFSTILGSALGSKIAKKY